MERFASGGLGKSHGGEIEATSVSGLVLASWAVGYSDVPDSLFLLFAAAMCPAMDGQGGSDVQYWGPTGSTTQRVPA